MGFNSGFKGLMGTGVFKGVKRPGSSVDHPPHLAPRLTWE